MEREQIENDTGIRFFGPCKKALVIFFDQSDGAVDDGCAIRTQQICRLRQKLGQIGARHIDFGDDETRLITAYFVADLLCIIREVCAQLVRVGPVSLSVCRQIVIAVALESLVPIRVSEPQEIQPVVIA